MAKQYGVDDNGHKYVNIVSLKMVREKKLKYSNSVNNAADALCLLKKSLSDSPVEKLIVIGLDNSNNATCVREVSVGGVNYCSVSIPEVFKPLLLSNANQFILAHNHPSNYMVFSNADYDLAEKLKNAASVMQLHCVDFIAVNSDCTEYISLRNKGRL